MKKIFFSVVPVSVRELSSFFFNRVRSSHQAHTAPLSHPHHKPTTVTMARKKVTQPPVNKKVTQPPVNNPPKEKLAKEKRKNSEGVSFPLLLFSDICVDMVCLFCR